MQQALFLEKNGIVDAFNEKLQKQTMPEMKQSLPSQDLPFGLRNTQRNPVNKLCHFGMVFDARGGFDAAREVDACGTDCFNGLADIVRRNAAREKNGAAFCQFGGP